MGVRFPSLAFMKPDILFEISWEVCNKVGGIYAVLTTKVAEMQKYYHNSYFGIGPYFHNNIKGEFKEMAPPEEFKSVFKKLETEGIVCHFGQWLIHKEINVILIDYNGLWNKINDYKGWFWQEFRLDTLGSPRDFDEPFLWSIAVGRFLEEYFKEALNNKFKAVAHFHEWLSGGALLYLYLKKIPIATVFTTHATVLGRALAGDNKPLYEEIEKYNPEQEAKNYGVLPKHQLEKLSASLSHILTTVSSITAIEVEHFLGRKADILLPNGLDIQRVLSFEDISYKHHLKRERLREFLLYYFFPYYTFDIKETLFYFISGRYEIHNKGINVLLDALANLNQRLKKVNSKKTIVAFVFIPAPVRGIKIELVESRENYLNFKQSVLEEEQSIESMLLYNLISGLPLSENILFESKKIESLKYKLLKFRNPADFVSITTHDLLNSNDPIIAQAQKVKLLNHKNDKVKIIIYPIYLGSSDGLLNMTYEEVVQGSHLGVFPSYYEPWGYTPLETIAQGVPAVTTDLAGFGRFIEDKIKNKSHPGIFIVKRYKKEYNEIVTQLADILFDYSCHSQQERVLDKIEARQLSEYAGWENLIRYYLEAHNKAIGILWR